MNPLEKLDWDVNDEPASLVQDLIWTSLALFEGLGQTASVALPVDGTVWSWITLMKFHFFISLYAWANEPHMM